MTRKAEAPEERVFLEPTEDRVAIFQHNAKTMSDHGLIIPDGAAERPTIGIVQAVGPGKLLENGTRIPLDFQVGDEVMYGQYTAAPLQLHGVDWLLIRASDILAKIVREKVAAE